MKNVNQKGRIGKRLCVLLLSAVMLISALTVGASAASGAIQITAQLCPHFTIFVDGVEQTFYNVQGQEVHPILYEGTTYLPVRAIGELMGKNVNWDQSTLTATLSGVRTTPRTIGTPDYNAVQADVSAEIRQDFTIVVDGVKRTFTDVNGAVVYPMLYNGSTYLPVRAIGGLMGCTVGWDGTTSTITLTSTMTGDSLVTDADTFESTQPNQTTPPSGITNTEALTAIAAQAKALAHAGLTSNQVTFRKCKLDHEDSHQVYEIEFYTAGGEYEYEINASTGSVLSFEFEAKGQSSASSGSRLTEEKAQALALSKVPGASNSNVTRVRLSYDGGWWKYKVKIVYSGMEYEFTIDAYSGAFRAWKGELIGH